MWNKKNKHKPWKNKRCNGRRRYNDKFWQMVWKTKKKTEIIKRLLRKSLGNKKINYKLRDWGISRQRIGAVQFNIVQRRWISCSCSRKTACSSPSSRQNNSALQKELVNGKTLFVNRRSCWNHTLILFWVFCIFFVIVTLRWSPFCKGRYKLLVPVDQYIGGIEYAILHLYSRFFTKP